MDEKEAVRVLKNAVDITGEEYNAAIDMSINALKMQIVLKEILNKNKVGSNGFGSNYNNLVDIIKEISDTVNNIDKISDEEVFSEKINPVEETSNDDDEEEEISYCFINI